MHISIPTARRLGAKTVRHFGYQVKHERYSLHYISTTAGTERYPWAISTIDGEGVEEYPNFNEALVALLKLGSAKQFEDIKLPPRFDPRCTDDEDISEFIRAGGDALCEVCWQELWRHPYCPAHAARADDGTGRTYSWLHVLCDGTHVKL